MINHVPAIFDTDLLIAGCTTGAVDAALAARETGKSVLCITHHTYPGEDLCSHLRLWPNPDQKPRTELARRLFADALENGGCLTPMALKLGLETAMLDAGVEYLYMSYPLNLLRDAAGRIAGVLIANRSGVQAIRAKVVIDATERAVLARMSHAEFRPFEAGMYAGRWTCIGAEDLEVENGSVKQQPDRVTLVDKQVPASVYELSVDMPDTGPGSFARAECTARMQTWHPDELVAADSIELPLNDRLLTGARVESWTGANSFDLKATRAESDSLFILGPLADVADSVAAELRKPCNLMAVGRRLGTLAAELAAGIHSGAGLSVDYRQAPIEGCDVCRCDSYFRYEGAAAIDVDLNRLPMLGEFDVVVAGGGTAGAPAGIAAARAGAKTLILEYLPGLGGVGTEGRIAKYWHGNRCGFTSEIDRGVHAMGPNPEFDVEDGQWNTEWKRHWYLKTAVETGAEVWFSALTIAAVKDGDKVCGVAVATPQGCGVIKANSVVDASGNADVAAAAGAEVVNISKAHVAVQGTGLPPLSPGHHYQNSDHTFVDDTDVIDVTRAFSVARRKFSEAFDLAQMIDSRQRQQVKGDFFLDPLDFLAGRRYPDTIVTAMSNFDSHGFTIHPVFMAKAPNKESITAHVPFRCLLPAGIEGVLVTGLGVCAHRDALPVIRMQPDVQNQGYAAGRAAVMAAEADCAVREIDIKALQRHLVEIGILTEDVPDHTDTFPLPTEMVADAVENGVDEYLGLAVIFGQPDQSLPLLKQAYQAAQGDKKLRYAHILGLMGDDTGLESLTAALDAREWDKGWNFTGMGQFGFSLSPVDTMLIALGRTGNDAAVPTMLRKIEALQPENEFSHFRAVTLAFEALPSSEAAPHFTRLLESPRITGKCEKCLGQAAEKVSEDINNTTERNAQLTELLLARGLYACGDPDGKARQVLEAYSQDLHGHYARHARALLKANGDSRCVP